MRLLNLHTILAASDLTAGSDAAIVAAASLAEASGAALHVAHVIPEDAGVIAGAGKRSEFELELRQQLDRLDVSDSASQHAPIGEPPEQLAALAGRLDANVIITGRHRDGALPTARPLGGTAWAVVTRSLTPCLAVLDHARAPVRRALVGIDSSRASRGALLVAVSWLSALRDRSSGDAVLTVLHVHNDADGGSQDMTRMVTHEVDVLRRQAMSWAGVQVEPITVRDDDAVLAIARAASERGAELVVVGTRGVGASAEGSLGSVSAGLLRIVGAPVLLVPPAVWRNVATDMDYF